jgi:hypothetical protein
MTDEEFDREFDEVNADIHELIDNIRERGWDDELIAQHLLWRGALLLGTLEQNDPSYNKGFTRAIEFLQQQRQSA